MAMVARAISILLVHLPDSPGDGSDIRGLAPAIATDADVVLFINRKNPALAGPAESPEEEEELRKAEIIIGKQRNGPTDMFKLVYFDEFTRFENLALGSER